MHPLICYMVVKHRLDELREVEGAARGRGRRTSAWATRRARRARILAAAGAHGTSAAAPGCGS